MEKKKKRNIDDYRNLILKEHSEGKTLKEICSLVGFYPDKISKYLKSFGLKPHHNNKTKWVNEHYFDSIDSAEKAYILGFFIADGCIREEYDKRDGGLRTRLCFANSTDDAEIIERIHDILCPYNKIQYTHNTAGAKNRKPQIQIQWTSRTMVKNLKELFGIVPKKTFEVTYIFPFEKIDKKYHRDFIRGFIDGDGTISKEDIRFVFNSPLFAKQIVDIFYENVYLPNKDLMYDFKYTLTEINGKNTKYWRVRIPTGHGKYRFYKKYLYDNAKMFLSRKKKRLEDE